MPGEVVVPAVAVSRVAFRLVLVLALLIGAGQVYGKLAPILKVRRYVAEVHRALDEQIPQGIRQLDAQQAAADEAIRDGFGVERRGGYRGLSCALSENNGFGPDHQFCELVDIAVYPSVSEGVVRAAPGDAHGPLGAPTESGSDGSPGCPRWRRSVDPAEVGEVSFVVGGGGARCFRVSSQSYPGATWVDLAGTRHGLPVGDGLYVVSQRTIDLPAIPCTGTFNPLSCTPAMRKVILPE